MFVRRTLLIASLAAAAGTSLAASLPYDEAADPKAELRNALASAGATKRPVLVIFGANWCEDCRALDAAMKSAKTAELLGREFVVVKVDVGRFDRNLPIAEQYGNPIKGGIPAAVVLSPSGQVAYTTRLGELSSARRMSASGIHDFFAKAAANAKSRP
jgi:thioredoxin 1